MNQLFAPFRIAFLVLTVLFCSPSHGQAVLTSASQKQLKSVVDQFAASHYLGSGAKQFTNGIKPVSSRYAVAILGELYEDKRHEDAYTVHVRLIKGKWKVVSFDVVPAGTTTKRSEVVTPPFPDPYWKNVLQ